MKRTGSIHATFLQEIKIIPSPFAKGFVIYTSYKLPLY